MQIVCTYLYLLFSFICSRHANFSADAENRRHNEIRIFAGTDDSHKTKVKQNSTEKEKSSRSQVARARASNRGSAIRLGE